MTEKTMFGDNALEYFGCDCGSYHHTFLISYFKNDKGDLDESIDIFYLHHPIMQYRTKKIPCFWSLCFWQYECFSKHEWSNFFYTSVWKRWYISFKYLFSKEPIDIRHGIFDCISLRNDDLQRLVKTLSSKRDDTISDEKLQSELDELKKRNIIFEVENTYYKLQFVVDDLEKEIENGFSYPKHIGTQFQFIKKNGFAKFIEAVYFGFGGTHSNRNNDEFELSKKDATILLYAVADFIKNLPQ